MNCDRPDPNSTALAPDSAAPDPLSEEAIRGFPPETLRPYWAVLVLPTIDSTNEEAKRQAAKAPSPLLIVAEEQTAGKGRRGRAFYSPANSGIYMSILLPLDRLDQSPLTATPAAAVAVTRAIERVTGIACGIKWVNDIYLDDLKICGILAEGVPDGTGGLSHLIIGIGINTHPADLAAKAGDRAGDLGGDLSRNELIAAVTEELWSLLTEQEPADYMADYRARSTILGQRVRLFDTTLITADHPPRPEDGIPATVLAITDEGGLHVRYEDGREETITSGEITLRREEDL